MAPVRSFSQIDHDVVGTAGKDRLGRLVVGIALDVVQMGRHEDEVAWTRLHVLLEVLTEVDSDVALQHVGCGLGLAMVIRRTHCIRNTSYLTQPDLACARRITIDARTTLHPLRLSSVSRAERKRTSGAEQNRVKGGEIMYHLGGRALRCGV